MHGQKNGSPSPRDEPVKTRSLDVWRVLRWEKNGLRPWKGRGASVLRSFAAAGAAWASHHRAAWNGVVRFFFRPCSRWNTGFEKARFTLRGKPFTEIFQDVAAARFPRVGKNTRLLNVKKKFGVKRRRRKPLSWALKKCQNSVFSDCAPMKMIYPGTHECELKQWRWRESSQIAYSAMGLLRV